MPAERYYAPLYFTLNEEIHLDGPEHHHLIQVMRTRLGDEVEIVNGKGQLASAQLLRAEKKFAALKILNVTALSPPNYSLILAQAIPKANRLDFIVEKGTELGMSELWLFPGHLSEKTQISETLMVRLQSIALAAMKQCGRLYLPNILMQPPLIEWKTQKLPLFFGDTTSDAPKFTHAPENGLIFVVGPEKGLSEQELFHLKMLNAQGVKLHSNILRTETASLAALTLMNYFFS